MPSPRARRRALVIALVVAVAAGVLSIGRKLRAGDERRRVNELALELRHARAAVDSCTAALAREEAAFREHNARVDSLRAEVRRYEAMHPRGVPADSYPAYYDVFARYNRGVREWRARADSLRGHLAECRARGARHNEIVDTLRGLRAGARDD